MREIGIYVDESGEQEGYSRYYLLTFVFLEGDRNIDSVIECYELSLQRKHLPNIPFHASPLMNGNDEYSNLTIETRKRLLNAFNVFSQNLPVRYMTLCYRRKEFDSSEKLFLVIRRDVEWFLSGNLEYFQSFDTVNVFYDGGQKLITKVLEGSFNKVLSNGVPCFLKSDFRACRLSQVADYFCAIELACIKYEHHEQTATDIKVFGYVGTFKNNYLKQAKRKRFS